MKSLKPFFDLKKDLVTVCKLMHQKGFVAGTDGNVSIKIDSDRFLMTPSQLNKAFVTEEDLIVIDSKGKVIEGKRKVTSEYLMHMKVYEMREDVGAVVHAHPPLITAFSISQVEIPSNLLPELILTIGKIPITKYATPSSEEGAFVIEDLIGNHDAIILDHHGSLTVGDDVISAYNKLEKIEHAAYVTLISRQLGSSKPLDEDSIDKLTYMAINLGVRRDLKY